MRLPDGSRRSTRSRRTTREPGILERDIVGRRIALDDAEILTKYVFPFVDSMWKSAFTVVDRIGGPPWVLDAPIRAEGSRLRAFARGTDLRAVESIPLAHFEALAHFDPWWAFRGMSGVERRWIEVIFATNIARTFEHEGRGLKVHDLRFSDDLRALEAVLAKDDAFRLVELRAGEIDLLALRRAQRSRPWDPGAAGSAKAL